MHPIRYRVGSCSGTTNGFTCKAQPTCPAEEFLKGSSLTAAGTCTKCANIKCPDEQYRVGSCTGTNDGYVPTLSSLSTYKRRGWPS